MKNKNSYIKKIDSYLSILTALVLLLIFFSCRSTDTDNKISNEQATVVVNLQGETFEDTGVLGTVASNNHGISSEKNITQKFEIPFNKEFSITAELSPVAYENKQTQASSKINPIAATETTPLGANIRYKVVVYKSTGEYVTERDYTRTQEANTAALNLDGGSSYTFIAYSVNSTTNLPAVTFSNTANKTLLTSSVSALASNNDFMYYRKDMQVSGNGPNYLDVVLRHRLSLITTTIDASATGYNITAVNSNFDSQYPSYNAALSDGTITRTGTVGNISPVFPTLGTSVIVSNPTLINAETTAGKFTISSITIGPLTQTPNSGLTGLTITAGVKYNLKLRLNPIDILLDYNGQKAVRISGQIWMRHNLGANTALDPDQNPSVSGLHGNYYQFGRIASVATGTEVVANSNYNGNPAAFNAWNTGTEASPVKTATDPCPSGYRIPTRTEFQALVDNTIQSNIGTWSAGDTNYTAAKVLTSKRNSNVKMSLPAQGAFGALGGNTPPYTYTWYWTNQRGTRVSYWTSTSNTNNDTSYFDGNSTSATVTQLNGNPSIKVLMKSVRCIAQ
ncbi:hypothetical protein CMT52_13210 [Elizabethkingia anophelis]|uniref:FISUMP domain-containing protein n=1 Tax=Elizabethkingia anophelis TaxID=1117645 RepID=UPI00293C13CD|nr:hypothetical protein [Elizabethkingia anophelis]MDV4025290.1 hypothetical protein [Elizabethkingia anophelis]